MSGTPSPSQTVFEKMLSEFQHLVFSFIAFEVLKTSAELSSSLLGIGEQASRVNGSQVERKYVE